MNADNDATDLNSLWRHVSQNTGLAFSTAVIQKKRSVYSKKLKVELIEIDSESKSMFIVFFGVKKKQCKGTMK